MTFLRAPLPPLALLPPRAHGGSRPNAVITANATLVARLDLAPDLARFVVRPDAGVPAFQAGQYVTVGLATPTGPLMRPYSIATPPHEREHIELLIRRLGDGALTSRLWAVEPGGRLWLGPPKGLFRLDPDPDPVAPHVFLAAGTGVAPVLAMLGALAALDRPARPGAWLIQGASHVPELADQERLRDWARDGWLAHHPTVSRPDDPANAGWRGAVGRVESHIRRVFADRRLDTTRVRVFACGNDGMVTACREALAAAGVPDTSIRCESFTPGRSRRS